MELRHLRYFVAVAEERHFGRAADRLHVTQSTLSTQIQALEREAGGPLFLRTSRRVELTEAGALLLTEARRTLAQAERALLVTRQSTGGLIGQVRVGFAGVAVLEGLLISDLHRFRRHYPGVELSLVELPPAAQAEGVRDGSIDLGYSPDLGISDTAGLAVTRHGRSPLSIAVRAGHPLAAAGEVTLDDLADQDLITYAAHEDEATVLPRLWPDPRSHRGHTHLVGSTLGVLALAASGIGVAILPSAAARIALPDVVYRPLPDAVAGPELLTISRIGETSGAVRAFLAIAGTTPGSGPG